MEIDQTQALNVNETEDDDLTDELDSNDEKEPVAFLKVLCQKGIGESSFPLFEGDNIVGRNKDTCHVHIPSKSLSKEHACIQIIGDSHLLFDKNSRNKTLRGKLTLKPEVRYELKTEDEVTFADVKCRYEILPQNNMHSKKNISIPATMVFSESETEEGDDSHKLPVVEVPQTVVFQDSDEESSDDLMQVETQAFTDVGGRKKESHPTSRDKVGLDQSLSRQRKQENSLVKHSRVTGTRFFNMEHVSADAIVDSASSETNGGEVPLFAVSTLACDFGDNNIDGPGSDEDILATKEYLANFRTAGKSPSTQIIEKPEEESGRQKSRSSTKEPTQMFVNNEVFDNTSPFSGKPDRKDKPSVATLIISSHSVATFAVSETLCVEDGSFNKLTKSSVRVSESEAKVCKNSSQEATVSVGETQSFPTESARKYKFRSVKSYDRTKSSLPGDVGSSEIPTLALTVNVQDLDSNKISPRGNSSVLRLSRYKSHSSASSNEATNEMSGKTTADPTQVLRSQSEVGTLQFNTGSIETISVFSSGCKDKIRDKEKVAALYSEVDRAENETDTLRNNSNDKTLSPEDNTQRYGMEDDGTPEAGTLIYVATEKTEDLDAFNESSTDDSDLEQSMLKINHHSLVSSISDESVELLEASASKSRKVESTVQYSMDVDEESHEAVAAGEVEQASSCVRDIDAGHTLNYDMVIEEETPRKSRLSRLSTKRPTDTPGQSGQGGVTTPIDSGPTLTYDMIIEEETPRKSRLSRLSTKRTTGTPRQSVQATSQCSEGVSPASSRTKSEVKSGSEMSEPDTILSTAVLLPSHSPLKSALAVASRTPSPARKFVAFAQTLKNNTGQQKTTGERESATSSLVQAAGESSPRSARLRCRRKISPTDQSSGRENVEGKVNTREDPVQEIGGEKNGQENMTAENVSNLNDLHPLPTPVKDKGVTQPQSDKKQLRNGSIRGSPETTTVDTSTEVAISTGCSKKMFPKKITRGKRKTKNTKEHSRDNEMEIVHNDKEGKAESKIISESENIEAIPVKDTNEDEDFVLKKRKGRNKKKTKDQIDLTEMDPVIAHIPSKAADGETELVNRPPNFVAITSWRRSPTNNPDTEDVDKVLINGRVDGKNSKSYSDLQVPEANTNDGSVGPTSRSRKRLSSRNELAKKEGIDKSGESSVLSSTKKSSSQNKSVVEIKEVDNQATKSHQGSSPAAKVNKNSDFTQKAEENPKRRAPTPKGKDARKVARMSSSDTSGETERLNIQSEEQVQIKGEDTQEVVKSSRRRKQISTNTDTGSEDSPARAVNTPVKRKSRKQNGKKVLQNDTGAAENSVVSQDNQIHNESHSSSEISGSFSKTPLKTQLTTQGSRKITRGKVRAQKAADSAQTNPDNSSNQQTLLMMSEGSNSKPQATPSRKRQTDLKTVGSQRKAAIKEDNDVSQRAPQRSAAKMLKQSLGDLSPNRQMTRTGSEDSGTCLSSPSRGRSARSSRVQVMLTGFIDETADEVVKQLGGEMVTSVQNCTHLVAERVCRTVKFLCGLAKGLLIVSPEWLKCSKQAGTFLDGHMFVVSDPAMEKQYQFSLAASIKRAQSQPLLEHYQVHVTESVKPVPVQMQDILKSAGAQCLKTMPRELGDKTVVISSVEDHKLCLPAIEAGIPVVGPEFILTGILRQELDIQSYLLFQDTKVETSTKGKGKKK